MSVRRSLKSTHKSRSPSQKRVNGPHHKVPDQSHVGRPKINLKTQERVRCRERCHTQKKINEAHRKSLPQNRAAPIEVIDLAVTCEQCAVCDNILGQGTGDVSRMFAFQGCGHVLCGECALTIGDHVDLHKGWHGEDLKMHAFCSKVEHVSPYLQQLNEIYSLQCPICLDDEIDGFRFLPLFVGIRSWEQDPTSRVYATCGHTFCCHCVRKYWVSDAAKACPVCGLREVAQFSWVRTVQRGVAEQSTDTPWHPRV